MNSDTEHLVNPLHKPFKRLPTLPAAVIQIFLSLCQIILVFVLPEMCERHKDTCSSDSFSVLIYSHGGIWCATLVIDQFYHYQHHKARIGGYLEFYIKTKNARRAPFYIMSAGNAVLMIVVMILHDVCDNNPNCHGSFTKLDLMRGLLTLESLAVMCLVASYIIMLRDFNSKQLPPDVMRDDIMEALMSVGHLATPTVYINRQDENEHRRQVGEVMERQAEVIRYLKEHSETLGGKILDLTKLLSRVDPEA